jgi:hypothetical protein
MSDSAKQKLDNIIRHDNIMGAPRSHWRRCCKETWRFRRWAWLKNWGSTRQSKFDRLKPTKPRLKKNWILVGQASWGIIPGLYVKYTDMHSVYGLVFRVPTPPKAWVSICKLFAAFLRSNLVFTRYLQHFWLPASHLLGICYLLDDLH